MPIRFTSPSLGGQRQVFLQGGEWEAGVAYRRLTAGDWFVGDKIVPSAGPFGEPVHFNINTFDLSLAYGVSRRLSVRLTVPVTTGTSSRLYEDLDNYEAAVGCYERALKGAISPALRALTLQRLPMAHKKLSRHHEALRIWEELVARETTLVFPYIELATPASSGRTP